MMEKTMEQGIMRIYDEFEIQRHHRRQLNSLYEQRSLVNEGDKSAFLKRKLGLGVNDDCILPELERAYCYLHTDH
jgi:hypothetical protein